MKDINSLHLISGLGQGGAEKVLLDMSIEFKKNKNIENYIVSFSNETALLSEFEKNGINVTVLHRKKSFQNFYKMILEISTYIKNQEIDIIHAHMSHAMIVAVILRMRFPKLKVVFTPHSVHFGNKLREGIIFLLKPFREIDILFSENMKQWFNKENYKVIPNGIRVVDFNVDIEKFEKFTFIAVGNIKEAKNYPFLIDCANELRKSFDFQLLIIGGGKDKVLLEKQVSDLGLEKYVYLKGSQNNVSELLSKSHCLVVPSLWEGMPLSILEAGASRLPVVSTPVGAIPSIIDESNGYLAKEDMFCETMKYVFNHYEEAAIKAEKLQKKIIENYSIKSIAKKHGEVYASLMNFRL
ncbi:glycosyltransferase [Sulfurovum sp. TSL1]|uniref:glycosyltransferase n=1 Tax=Sulfurovum sp. TSL1 TaxID=2826994 RepID=UPI001CC34EE8|nr:glycosyltransferase [Sulfurovum sp. TSL1]GIT98127.1 glycosyl transferase [Sulfurovum sp. TSL1]